jgi:S-DNA-T family DNA segregation ATPase FtsK/SpoIIIE
VELYLLDGKMVELAAWRDCADGWAGVSVAEANALLCELQAEMEARYAWLLEIGKRKVERGDGPGLAVVVVDELAHYLTNGTKDERAEFADRLRDLVSRGRAAGVIVIAATQKPSSDVIPTPQASDTILGAGWASQGYSAADIDPAARGVGWLLHEGGVPVRLRSYWLDDDAIRAIARRAAALRGRKGGRGAG